MPLSQIEMMVDEQSRYEAQEQAKLIRALNLGMHGQPKDLKAEISRLTS